MQTKTPGMVRTTVTMIDEAFQVAQKRIGYARRGLGRYLSVLVLQDEARRLAQREREQEDVSTQASGCNVD